MCTIMGEVIIVDALRARSNLFFGGEQLKKVTIFLVLSIILATYFSFSAFAETSNNAKVEFKVTEPDTNGIINVEMRISSLTFRVFQFALRYDPKVAVPVDKNGNPADSFESFAVKSQDTKWLSTVGTELNAKTGLIDLSAYIMPGTTGGPLNGNYEAVIGSDGLLVYTFYFKVIKTGDMAFQIATEEKGEPYRPACPEGIIIDNENGHVPATVVFNIPQVLGTSKTEVYTGTSAPATQPQTINPTADELLNECLILKIDSNVLVANSGVTEFYPGEKTVVPFIDSTNRTFVPLRFIAEKLGAQVEWLSATKTAVIKSGDTEIKMSIGDSFYYKNGIKCSMDTASQLIESTPGYVRTVVPVRFVAEALGKTVAWDGNSSFVIVAPGNYKWGNNSKTETDVIKKANSLLLMYGNFIQKGMANCILNTNACYHSMQCFCGRNSDNRMDYCER